MNGAIYVLWRPSFAGSWRSIGEFSSWDEAQSYAESKPWDKHGIFTDWEIHTKGERPESRPITMPKIRPGSTAYVETAIFPP